jgi:hypothetical protein
VAYVNAGDTLTIQMQGQVPAGAAVGSFFTLGSTAALVAQDVVNVLNGEGFAAAIDSSNVNTDGSSFVQIDVTASQDYADSSDVLSIAENAWYQSTNQYPSSAVVSDTNGVSTNQTVAPATGPTTLGGVLNNPSVVATPLASATGSLLSGLQQFGTTTLIFIAVIVLALLYFLTTEGGQSAAKLALA